MPQNCKSHRPLSIPVRRMTRYNRVDTRIWNTAWLVWDLSVSNVLNIIKIYSSLKYDNSLTFLNDNILTLVLWVLFVFPDLLQSCWRMWMLFMMLHRQCWNLRPHWTWWHPVGVLSRSIRYGADLCVVLTRTISLFLTTASSLVTTSRGALKTLGAGPSLAPGAIDFKNNFADLRSTDDSPLVVAARCTSN